MTFADDFRAAWHTRDHAAITALFAPDAVLHSPIITTPFEGRELLASLYRSLFDNMPPTEFVGEATLDDGRLMLLWQTTFDDGTVLDGTDIVTLGDDGLAREVLLMMRPLVGTAAFLKAIGPDLARERSTMHGRLIKAVNVVFAVNAKTTDRMAPRFLPQRNLH